MGIFLQYAPYTLREGTWDELREPFGDRVISLIEEYAPNIRQIIEHRQVLTPLDLERRFGITGGNIFHGEMSLDQMFVMRPVAGWARYRTPVAGLYLCGSGAHPGRRRDGRPGLQLRARDAEASLEGRFQAHLKVVAPTHLTPLQIRSELLILRRFAKWCFLLETANAAIERLGRNMEGFHGRDLCAQYNVRRPFLTDAGTFGWCSMASRKSASSATVKGSSWIGFKMVESGGAAAALSGMRAWAPVKSRGPLKGRRGRRSSPRSWISSSASVQTGWPAHPGRAFSRLPASASPPPSPAWRC